MWTRHRLVCLVIVGGCVAGGVVATALLPVSRGRYEDGAMVVTWEKCSRKPLIVEGIVVRQGVPVAGQWIDAETDSGGNPVITGPDGRFSVNVAECELRSLEVRGFGRVDWGQFLRPSTKEGLRFEIRLKAAGPEKERKTGLRQATCERRM